jgi:hypothetical protein
MSLDPDLEQYSVSDAPSVGTDPNANPRAFVTPGTNQYQTIIPSGIISKDQVFATISTNEVIPPEAIKNYDSFLTLSNKVRPVTSLAPTDFSINQQYVDEAIKRRKRAMDLISGTGFSEEDLIVTVKSTTIASPLTFDIDDPGTTAPTVVSKDFTGLPVAAGVYAYNPTELFDDRYDFETGKKIRVGIAGGIAGGAGDVTTKGNVASTVEQTESSNNTTSDLPVVKDEQDPCG